MTVRLESKLDPNNYRPISVLPKRRLLTFIQLYNYLNEHGLLADSQHGFRPTHSTLTELK